MTYDARKKALLRLEARRIECPTCRKMALTKLAEPARA